jgi:hypothetical protein
VKDHDYKTAIYTPAETTRLGLQEVERAEENKHRTVKINIPAMQSYFKEMLPGEICAILAQQHNFKSGQISSWEYSLARQLFKEGRKDEIIVHVDVETVIEHQAAQIYSYMTGIPAAAIMRGQVNEWKELKVAVSKAGAIPIYRIGASLGRDGIGFEDLYLSNVFSAIKYIQGHDQNNRLLDREVTIAAIFLDYLQAFPIDPQVSREAIRNQRRLQVREDVYRIRNAAREFMCPIICGVQARQELRYHLGINMMLPGAYDAEETSSIAQRFDRVISFWMPKTTHSIGSELKHGDLRFRVTEDLIWSRVCKQRGGMPSGACYPLIVDYDTGRMTLAHFGNNNF